MAFAGVGMLLYAAAPIWIALLAVAFVASIGKGAIDAALNNFVSINYGASEMNWLHASWGIGLTIAPSVVTFYVVDQGVGWQSSYIMTGAIILLLGLVILLSLPAWQFKSALGDKDKPAQRTAINETLRQPIVLIGLLFFFVYGGVEIGTGQLANTLLIEARGLPQAIASSWVSAYWGSFTVGRILMGLLAMRLGDRTLLNISFAASVLGALAAFQQLARYSKLRRPALHGVWDGGRLSHLDIADQPPRRPATCGQCDRLSGRLRRLGRRLPCRYGRRLRRTRRPRVDQRFRFCQRYSNGAALSVYDALGNPSVGGQPDLREHDAVA